jgi:hypothetical protein
MFTHKVLQRKDIFYGMCKKDKKNDHVNNNVGTPKFVFLQRPQKMFFSHETSWMNIKYLDVYIKIFFQYF